MENITWIENLRRGFSALLLHPFAPLVEQGFNYNCLFSKEQFCLIRAETKPSQIGKNINNKGFVAGIEKLTEPLQQILSAPWKKLTYGNGSINSFPVSNLIHLYNHYIANYMPILQLSICTILISNYIIKDYTTIRSGIKYYRARLRIT